MYVLLNNLKPHGKMSMNLFMSECCIPAERIFRFNKLLKPDCFMVSVSHYSIYYAGLTYSLFSVIFKYLEGYMVSVFSRRHFHKNHIPFLFFFFFQVVWTYAVLITKHIWCHAIIQDHQRETVEHFIIAVFSKC